MGRSRSRSNGKSRKEKKSHKSKKSRSRSRDKYRDRDRERERDKKRKHSRSVSRKKDKKREKDRKRDKSREKSSKRDKSPVKKELSKEELEKLQKQRRIRAILMKYDSDDESEKEQQKQMNKDYEERKQKFEEEIKEEDKKKKKEEMGIYEPEMPRIKAEEGAQKLNMALKEQQKKVVFVDSDGLEDDDDEINEIPIMIKQEEFNRNVPQFFKSSNGNSNQNGNGNGKNQEQEDEEEIDPLDAYLEELEGEVPKQKAEFVQDDDFENVPEEKVITLEQILAGDIKPMKNSKLAQMIKKEKKEFLEDGIEEENDFDFAKEKETNIKEEEENDKYYEEFRKKLQEMKKKDENVVFEIDSDDEKDMAYENQLLNGENQDDYFKKKQKLEMKKDLKIVDHLTQDYIKIRKNFYVEPKELKQMTNEEVAKYREELGDIQVKSDKIVNIPKPAQNWYQCGLTELQLQLLIKKKNYQKPFPIQCQCFPIITSGYDTIGVAETGSGKTLAYILPMIRHIQDQPPLREGDGPIGLVMVPTRELAQQIYSECKSFAKPLGLECIAVYGGAGIQGQLSELKKGAEIVICTPARLIDVLTTSNGKITNLNRVSFVVIDEADRMLDQGFEPQIVKILNNVRLDRQTVMFSATFPKNVESLAKALMDKPIEVIVGAKGQACTNIEQKIEVIDEVKKQLRLLEILGEWHEKGAIIIFVEKKQDCDILFQELVRFGYLSISLHGDMDPDDREFAIYDFKKGVANILVATSLCARGLDHRNVVLVINYDCPNHLEDYIHRIGRTGRAGQKGDAITFITPEQDKYASDLIKALQMSSQKVPPELIALDKAFKQKVAKGEAKIYQNKNRQGQGYQFTEEELGKQNAIRKELKRRFGEENNLSASESDDEDIFNKTNKKEEKEKKKTIKDKLNMIKNPVIKKEIEDEGKKAAELAIMNGLSQKEVQEASQAAIIKALDNHKVALRSIEHGTQQAADLISEFVEKEQINNNIVSADFEINDYPQNARAKVSGREFLGQIYDQFNCITTIQGSHFDQGKRIPAGQKKLYLHIEGDTKNAVASAYKEIKRVIEEAAQRNLSLNM